jgi:hypothetical protein
VFSEYPYELTMAIIDQAHAFNVSKNIVIQFFLTHCADQGHAAEYLDVVARSGLRSCHDQIRFHVRNQGIHVGNFAFFGHDFLLASFGFFSSFTAARLDVAIDEPHITRITAGLPILINLLFNNY